jgi:hypothetical protein
MGLTTHALSGDMGNHPTALTSPRDQSAVCGGHCGGERREAA